MQDTSDPNELGKRAPVKTATPVMTGKLDLVRACRKVSQLSPDVHPLGSG
jgi:hypothetical protein